MLNHTTDQLIKTLDVCFIHQYRLNEAANKIEHLFPLNEERYFACSSDEVAFIDQLIFRFAKLQDMIGDKLLIGWNCAKSEMMCHMIILYCRPKQQQRSICL